MPRLTRRPIAVDSGPGPGKVRITPTASQRVVIAGHLSGKVSLGSGTGIIGALLWEVEAPAEPSKKRLERSRALLRQAGPSFPRTPESPTMIVTPPVKTRRMATVLVLLGSLGVTWVALAQERPSGSLTGPDR